MRRLIAILLSLLTGIGGHYLNRRWDRAAFFMGLLFVGMIAAYFTLWGTLSVGPEAEPSGFLIDVERKWRYLFAGLGVILLISAFVTWRDSRPDARVSVPWCGAVPVVGAVLTTLMSLSLLGYVGLVGWIAVSAADRSARMHENGAETISPDVEDSASAGDGSGYPYAEAWLMQSLYLGGTPDYGIQLDPLPEGDAYLVGRLEFQNQPVIGAIVKLTLNGKYASARATTDEQGRYTLRVPPGEWRVNAVNVLRWPGKPRQGEYLLVSGLESAADIHRSQPRQLYYDKGLPITATTEPTLNPALRIHIREHLHLLWPTADQQKISARVSDDVVRWSAYPAATHYRVEISEVTRSVNSARYDPVASKTVTRATELPLSALPTLPGDTKSREYSVEVTALAEDGAFLTVSEHAFHGASFTLTDGHRFIEGELKNRLGAGASVDDLQQVLANDKRLDAVVVLIQDGMLDTAEPLLAKVDMASTGRKAAVAGYLRASQGRCEEAAALLNQAMAEGGSVCVPAAYWAGCR